MEVLRGVSAIYAKQNGINAINNKNPKRERERERERDQEKGCENRGHRGCDPLGTFGDLEVSLIGKERCLRLWW